MGKHRHFSPDEDEPPAPAGDAVGRNLGSEYWSVDDCAWSSLRPGLPDDLVELLAPPIVVGAVPVVGIARPPASALAGPPAVTVAQVPVHTTGPSGVPTRTAGSTAKTPAGGSGRPATPVAPRATGKSSGTTRPPGRHRRGTPTA